MSWDLEIHHIDVATTGDATLFLARYWDANGIATHTRTLLIDGGKRSSAAVVKAYLDELGITRLDVVCVTHFDSDHYMGVQGLAVGYPDLFQDTVLYDYGWPPGIVREEGDKSRVKEVEKYDAALENLREEGRITWVTHDTNSWHLATFRGHAYRADYPLSLPFTSLVMPPVDDSHVWHPPYWLIGREVLWGRPRVHDGEFVRGDDDAPVLDDAAPGGAPDPPRIRCVAANMWVARDASDGGPPVEFVPDRAPSPGNETEAQFNRDMGKHEGGLKNQKSLAFVVEFNNFRYYVGGDLEEKQEDGWTDSDSGHRYGGLHEYLNPGGALSSRFWAFKASHHGAQTATTRTFVDALLPSAAFLSVSENNEYQHPKPRTIAVLEGHEHEPINSRWRDGYRDGVDPDAPGTATREELFVAPPFPPAAPRAGVRHYLTGYQWPSQLPPGSKGGRRSFTAGNPYSGIPGHVMLRVSEEQSRRSREGMKYWVLGAVLELMYADAGVTLDRERLELIAESGVRYGGAAAAALAGGGELDGWQAAYQVAAHLGDVARPNDDDQTWGVITAAMQASQDGLNLEAARQKALDMLSGALLGGYPLDNRPKWTDDALVWEDDFREALARVIAIAVTGQPSSAVEQLVDDSQPHVRAAGFVASSELHTSDDAAMDRRAAALGGAATLGAVRAGVGIELAIVIGAAIRAQSAEIDMTGTANVVTRAGLLAGVGAELAAAAGVAAAVADAYEPDLSSVALGITFARSAAGIGSWRDLSMIQQRLDGALEPRHLNARFTVSCYRMPPEEELELVSQWWSRMHDPDMGPAMAGFMREAFPAMDQHEIRFGTALGQLGGIEIEPHYC